MILSTKLFAPPPSGSLVSRARLVDRLFAGMARALTLVSAPAGFGKSTLLSEWAAEIRRRGIGGVGWLSLDAKDNAPAQFWTYFVAAWQSALLAEGERPEADTPADALEQIHSLLAADEKRIADQIVGALVNLMLAVPARVLIVLDDYHQIHNPEIHASLAQLIERLPGQVRLAVATRSDPPLPVPRLRVREQINEIRAADLRFSGAEIAALFQRLPGVSFGEQDIAAIEASTEGWAAGLKMAALALQSQERSPEEARQFWASFTGRNVYILDYLTEEVLGNLPRETQDFLMKTSLLGRFTDGLCAAVVNPALDPAQVREILEGLERANLFLIPLDQERRWFRYHHLFADLLRVRLQQRCGEQIPALHARAAAWFEQAGLIEEAMQHAAAAQDWERAARMMEEHGNEFLDRGQLATVLQWVESLPAGLLRRRPNLCIQMAWALSHAGKSHLVGPMLQEAEAALADWERQKQGDPTIAPLAMTGGDEVRIRASLVIFRGYGLILAGQPRRALDLAAAALEAEPDLEARERAWLYWICGYANRSLGDIEQAARFFIQAVEIGRATGGEVWEDQSTDLGIVYRLSGRLDQAAQVFEEALYAGEQIGLRNKGNLSRVEAYLSAVRMEQNRVEEALEHARKAVHYLKWWPSHNHIATVHAFYGLELLATGMMEEAAAEIQLADQEQRKGQVTPFVPRLIETAWVRLWLARGDRAALETWAGAQPVDLPEEPAAHPFNEFEETRLISLARARLGLGRWTKDPAWLREAARLLDALAVSAEASRRIHAAVEIRLLGALTRWEWVKQGGDAGLFASACEWLGLSLGMGLPLGFRRVYINEGRELEDLLRAGLAKDRRWLEAAGLKEESARALLEDLSGGRAGWPAADPSPALPEPLTEREKDVLRMLAQGLSNREMAERLVLSEGTIKTHVHNLIGKLGAQSRMQVLARARELKLIS